MPDAQNGAAQHLASKCAGMNHGAYIRGSEEIHDVVLAGLDVDLDFGKAGNIGKCRAVTGVFVLGSGYQDLGPRSRRRKPSSLY